MNDQEKIEKLDRSIDNLEAMKSPFKTDQASEMFNSLKKAMLEFAKQDKEELSRQ